VLTAVDEYAIRHTEEIEASFKKAVAKGFEALWQFGLQVANTLWPEGGRRDDSPFCVVMAVASKTGMAEQDMQVLRRNMTRLWKKQRKGGLS
jgi:hypothetical protein